MTTSDEARAVEASSALLQTQSLDDGGEEQKREVLQFLAARPPHTVFLSGLVRDNGLMNPANRGKFYACRNAAGNLEGVALIGHTVIFETRHKSAIAAFARLTQDYPQAHVVIGEREKIDLFSRYYGANGRRMRLLQRELLFEQRRALEALEFNPNLRPAMLDDLKSIALVNAAMITEKSGIDPLQVDAAGFRERLQRRIERGRIWVLTENRRLIFKAESIADTSQVIYLEGVYVNPNERGKGHGLRCLSQLGRNLLERTNSICLLVDEENRSALNLYRRANYEMHSAYSTLYLH
nr:GNAT family N-acetyltransferase [Pyrinomonadaceae bacterium]